MSIAAFSVSEAAIAAHDGRPAEAVRKPPKKRMMVAVADTTQSPEPR